MAKGLTARQNLFAKAYVDCQMNGTKAAIAIGCDEKSAGVQASKWLKIVKVRARIDQLAAQAVEELGFTDKDVLKRAADLANSNMLDYISFGDDGQADLNLKNISRDQAYAIQEITIDSTGGSGDGERRRVTRTRFKLIDKTKPLELLGKHHKLWGDKLEVTGAGGGPLETELVIKFVGTDGDS